MLPTGRSVLLRKLPIPRHGCGADLCKHSYGDHRITGFLARQPGGGALLPDPPAATWWAPSPPAPQYTCRHGHGCREVHDVPIGQPNASRGHKRADGRRLIGAVDAINGVAEIKCARAERVARTTRHETRQVGLAVNHLFSFGGRQSGQASILDTFSTPAQVNLRARRRCRSAAPCHCRARDTDRCSPYRDDRPLGSLVR